jgi:hypothetical protein
MAGGAGPSETLSEHLAVGQGHRFVAGAAGAGSSASKSAWSFAAASPSSYHHRQPGR